MLFRLALATRDCPLGLGGWSAYSLAGARCRARLLTVIARRSFSLRSMRTAHCPRCLLPAALHHLPHDLVKHFPFRTQSILGKIGERLVHDIQELDEILGARVDVDQTGQEFA